MGAKRESDFFNMLNMTGPGFVAVLRADDLKLLFVNRLFEAHFDINRGMLQRGGLYFSDLLEKNQVEKLKNQFKIVNDSVSARSAYVLYKLINREGVTEWYYLFAAPIFDEDGGSEGLYSVLLMSNLSRWNLPFTSYDTRELFFEQFQSEDFGTFEHILGLGKIFCSSGIYRIAEIDENQGPLNGELVSELIHPDDRAGLFESITDSENNGTDVDIEFKIVTSTRRTKTIHSIARTIRDQNGVARKFVGSVRDISSQREIEHSLKRKVEELNLSNKELEEFAYVASHDMQEPLRKITTFSTMLREKYKAVLAGDGEMYLSRMTSSAESMRVLINDLLDFSRIAKTQQPFEPVSLNVILRQVRSDLDLVVEETGTEIQSDSLPVIDAIPTQMKQLFVNIIGNAIKFHKPGVAPQIKIRVGMPEAAEKDRYDLDPKADYYKIVISDNGIGFEHEYSLRIFQVFQRLHGKSEYPGSGIGLAICKKIIEHHRGAIFAENDPGKGASFTFIVPAKRMEE